MLITGWIGRRRDSRRFYVPSHKRGWWKRRGHKLVRPATPEEQAAYEAIGDGAPFVLLSRLEVETPKPTDQNPPGGEGETVSSAPVRASDGGPDSPSPRVLVRRTGKRRRSKR